MSLHAKIIWAADSTRKDGSQAKVAQLDADQEYAGGRVWLMLEDQKSGSVLNVPIANDDLRGLISALTRALWSVGETVHRCPLAKKSSAT
jgi:hypothetical protein